VGIAPQPLRILAPMMPTRIFFVAMMIFPYASPDSGDLSYATRILLNIFVLPLLLPPASQRLVKLNERQTLVELGLHQVEFR
jgi:hypothetical protein